ncbi:hypothetical protein [Streptomyces sp. WAC05858]|uniref:hypothetical protein n=1 Tax=Streptomyces TaxID=1883 RepID=UPI000F7B28DD|nr:hypothetical protein [Streptomyces sp. WAC05858]RSS37951.1 hypothetical protein EF902_31625 [Streptomyces sp. WAC05858]
MTADHLSALILVAPFALGVLCATIAAVVLGAIVACKAHPSVMPEALKGVAEILKAVYFRRR